VTEPKTKWIVELEKMVWLAPWDGDPGRTCSLEGAMRLSSRAKADRELSRARKYHPFERAKIVEVTE